MRKLVAGLYISLDGVVEDRTMWRSPYFNDEMWQVIRLGLEKADAVLLGRRTYQLFAELWPRQDSKVPMADFLNNSPKYVASSTLEKVEWKNSVLLKGNLAEEIAGLKRQPGKNIQVPGSPTLVRSLLRDGLLDELSLFVFPIVVGSGLRLFDEIDREVRLRLVDSTTFGTGVLGVTYQPTGA